MGTAGTVDFRGSIAAVVGRRRTERTLTASPGILHLVALRIGCTLITPA